MNYNDCVAEIMDNFDFKKVQKIMTLMDWKWASIRSVPTEEDLRKSALRFLQSVANGEAECMGSGGLYAEDYGGNLKLSFVAEQWNSESVESPCQ